MNRFARRGLLPDSWIPWAVFLLLSGLGIAGLAFANYRFAQSAPGGTDFLVHWIGVRAVLDGRNPYSDQTALEIQTLVYGRPAGPGEHELRVAYPLYAEFLFLPFGWISDFVWARALWMTVLEIAAAAFAALAVFLSGAEWTRGQRVAFLVFSLSWYLGMRAIVNGNAVVLVSLFFGISLLCVKKRWDVAAGVFLACCTVKPQVALLPITAALFWAIRAGRCRMLLSFGAVMAALTGLSFAVLPTWLADNWDEIQRFALYNPPITPADVLREAAGAVGFLAGVWISVVVWLALLGIGIRLLRKREVGLLAPIGMTILLAPLSGIPMDPGNQFLLLLPLAMILSGRNPERISSRRFAGMLGAVFFGLWILFLLTVRMDGQPVQHPLMLFPLPLLLLGIRLWDAVRAHGLRAAGWDLVSWS
ncbi:MAG: DUF2029 domain-containing protein [Anaerolineales bacterium]|nr:DUF2029 domain-containing protein [Anaerolineales bacterium]